MMGKPFFSIVIPLYNKEKYIKKTLNSVQSQTFSDFEIIIVDDGSTDKSCEIVESTNDPHIRLIRQENGGPSKARNRGIKEAKGKFIAFLDADDEWLPTKLEKQYEFHSKYEDIVWSSIGYRAEGGKRVEEVSYYQEGVVNDAIEAIINGMSITSSTVVIKKNIFQNDRLMFNESFKRSEDREVWYKIACLYPTIGYISEILAVIHANTIGSLNATGLDEADFSFLSLKKRIEKELSEVDKVKKKKFLDYLDYQTKAKMLSIWGWTYSFPSISNYFVSYVDGNLLKLLSGINFMPLLAKKVFVKLYLATRRKYK